LGFLAGWTTILITTHPLCAKRYSCREGLNHTLIENSCARAPLRAGHPESSWRRNVPKRLSSTMLTELRQMNAVLHEHGLEMASLRAALDVQFKRIAHIQAELDILPTARGRRRTVRALLQPPPSHNSDGRSNR
jgi:hypothetical protein